MGINENNLGVDNDRRAVEANQSSLADFVAADWSRGAVYFQNEPKEKMESIYHLELSPLPMTVMGLHWKPAWPVTCLSSTSNRPESHLALTFWADW